METCRIAVQQHLVGRKILRTIVRRKNLRWPVSKEIYLINESIIVGAYRRAKYLLLQLKTGWIIIHLGMSGSLRILNNQCPSEKHDHIDVLMDNGTVLRYNDPRRFGAWIWANDLEHHHLISHLGPEPLSDTFDGSWIYKKSLKKKMAIKPWIMDQSLVVGVGNIYANESLFSSGINPYRQSQSLSLEECNRLAKTVKIILLSAIKQGGTTLRNFLKTNGKPGHFYRQLNLYGREGKPCYICNKLILANRQNQRRTYWCKYCQK